ESLLWKMLRERKMPPGKKDRLPDTEIETIRRWIAAGALSSSAPRNAAPSSAAPATERDIIHLMLLHCTVCHGGRRPAAGLDLRTRDGMIKGGKSGPAIVPGNPAASFLLGDVPTGSKHPLQELLGAPVRPMSADAV